MSQKNTKDTQATSRLNHLDKLPNELLSRIFKEAYGAAKPKEPLSRALLPFFRQAWFEEVKVVGFEQLARLAEAVLANAGLGAYFRKVTVALEVSNTKEDGPDKGVPADDTVARFFSSLPSLTSLAVSGSSRLALLILCSHATSSAFLPRLATLSLDCSSVEVQKRSRLSNLAAYADLRALSLASRGEEAGEAVDAGQGSVVLPQVTSLSLRASEASNRLKQLLSSFPSLTYLSLITGNPADIATTLSALPSPTLLTCLSLTGTPLATAPVWSAAALPRAFPSLCKLTLKGQYDGVEAALYAAIRSLPLTTLTLGRTKIISVPEIRALISGPTKHTTLESLVLSVVYAKSGTSIAHKDPPMNDYGEYEPHRDWTLPKWFDGFRAPDVRQLISAAKDSGVVLAGHAVRALQIEDAYAYEMDLLDAWLYEYGDDEDYEEYCCEECSSYGVY
ncbi:hypothetical protein JCM10213_002858 [Rhodosporidiobolus nylandii]